MTVREILGHLEKLCGIEVSPDLISAVTDAPRLAYSLRLVAVDAFGRDMKTIANKPYKEGLDRGGSRKSVLSNSVLVSSNITQIFEE